MPWKECHVVDERVRFVARLLDGETMTALCEEFGISRKTGYKIFQRYQQIGVRGLSDRSRRPYRHANQLPLAVETLIVRLKKDYPTWGAPKIRERLRQRWPDIACPAISTVHAVLDRHGLVTHRRRRRRPRLTGTPLAGGEPAERAVVRRLQRRVPARAISATAIRSRSPTSPAATCSPVKRCRRRKSATPSASSSARFRISACPRPSGPITACPSPPRTRSTA